MTTIAYWDCQAGIAGDMCLGALVSAGVPLSYLQDVVEQLSLPEPVHLSSHEVKKQGQNATKVEVHYHHHGHDHHHRHLPQIRDIIQQANLADNIKELSLKTFHNLAIAEGKVHGIPPEQVHFHEVGAVDAIVDIVGTCAGLAYLSIEEIYCSPLPTGGGTISCAHGQMPVPTPAVLELWRMGKVPIFDNGIQRELVTPTGATLAISLSKAFGSHPPMTITQIGIGAGTIDLDIPNILRLWIGKKNSSQTSETITILETQIDDTNPQTIAYTMELLLANGALDVFTQAIIMKKSRQGTLLTAICTPELSSTCQEIIFRETSTLGIRHRQQERSIIDREIMTISTPYGSARVKIATLIDGTKKVQPEYEDCAAIARSQGLPFSQIWELIQQAGKELL
jgi:uncharacterized protein (TIGR00299 family) protein